MHLIVSSLVLRKVQKPLPDVNSKGGVNMKAGERHKAGEDQVALARLSGPTGGRRLCAGL